MTQSPNSTPDRAFLNPLHVPHSRALRDGPSKTTQNPNRSAPYTLFRTNDIGSDRLSTLVMDHQSIGGSHARIFKKNQEWTLRDLSSSTGCWINDVRILEGLLNDGDRVRLGELNFIFSFIPMTLDVPTSKNPEWDEQLRELANFAKSETPVMISGDSGTGKELLANWIHKLSPRGSGPLVSINCSALSENLIESELFGHIKGSFTGATENRRGAFEVARGGTLFLDEVGDLPINLQPKLLRALENQEIRPVGSDRTVKTDVRVVAATHKKLPELVQRGEFRKDLFYRLNVCQIKAPRLIQRLEDFDDLAYQFAKHYKVRLTYTTLQEMKRHPWPGNIRELKNVVARARAYFPGEDITPERLKRILDTESNYHLVTTSSSLERTLPLIKDLEKRMIVERLIVHHGNQRRAAQDLGMPKSTLNDRIRAYGIDLGEITPRKRRITPLSETEKPHLIKNC